MINKIRLDSDISMWRAKFITIPLKYGGQRTLSHVFDFDRKPYIINVCV